MSCYSELEKFWLGDHVNHAPGAEQGVSSAPEVPKIDEAFGCTESVFFESKEFLEDVEDQDDQMEELLRSRVSIALHPEKMIQSNRAFQSSSSRHTPVIDPVAKFDQASESAPTHPVQLSSHHYILSFCQPWQVRERSVLPRG